MTPVWVYVDTSKQVDDKDFPIFGFPDLFSSSVSF